MRKKLSLFWVMLMALTMVLGTGITAMAAPAVNRCNSSDCNNEMVCVIGWDNDDWVEAYKYDEYGNYTGKGSIDPDWFADVPVAGKVYHDLSSYDHTGRTYAFALCPENDSNFASLPAEVKECDCQDADGTTLAYVIEVYHALDGKKYAHVNEYFYNGYDNGNVPYPLCLENVGDYFADEPIAGRVYHTKDNKYYLCDANAPTPTPTKETDGLEGELCSCGAVRNTQPLSAYGYALNEYATPMINAAKSGQTITFEFDEWNSFPKSFMAKLVDKSAQNVTFVFHYKWNHVKQEITIPAGTPIDLNFDWYGPAKMAELYGMY